MYINLYDLYKRKLRKFGRTEENSLFEDSFVDSVNLVYSELNEKVFQANLLDPIGSFDSIIDNRLAKFTTLTYKDASNVNDAISDREYWSVEYEFERMSATNGFTDTITDDASNVVISILDNTVSIVGDTVQASGDLSSAPDVFKLTFVSDTDGNRVIVNDDSIGMVYTTGDEQTTQKIGEVSSHVVSGVSGLEVLRSRFLSAGTLVYDYLINEGSGALLTDEVADYTADLIDQVWEKRYIEPSTGLDERYRSPMEYGIDWHLQDGGQWALEDDSDREVKWYGRGIRAARNTYQQLTTYKSPLNPEGL